MATQPTYVATSYPPPTTRYAPGQPVYHQYWQPGTNTYTVPPGEVKTDDSSKMGIGIVVGIIVLIVIALIVWWIIWAATRPGGKADGEICRNSDECQGFCNGNFRCASGTGGSTGSPCRANADCQVGFECNMSNNMSGNGNIGVCEPLTSLPTTIL